jgi:hypothetical protein
LVVVVVEVTGATGTEVVDCSVVVVLDSLSERPQPASNAVPETSATARRNREADFVSVMGNSVLDACRKVIGESPAEDAAPEILRGKSDVLSDRSLSCSTC